MREHKYRGKRIDNNKWVYGYYVKETKNINHPEEDKHYIFSNNKLGVYRMEVHPETVGQYTGRKDRNNNEIYEGDVLKYCYHVKPKDSYFFGCVEYHTKILEIGWENNKTLFVGFILRGDDNGKSWFTDIPNIQDIEVIGNIHENKDLLK